jgi:hypothetical protein
MSVNKRNQEEHEMGVSLYFCDEWNPGVGIPTFPQLVELQKG